MKNGSRRKREILYYFPTTIIFCNRTNSVSNVFCQELYGKMYFVFFTKSESFMQFLRVYQYLFNYLKCLVTMSQSVKSDKSYLIHCVVRTKCRMIYRYLNVFSCLAKTRSQCELSVSVKHTILWCVANVT